MATMPTAMENGHAGGRCLDRGLAALLRLEDTRGILGDCATCMAMSVSGAPIGMNKTTKALCLVCSPRRLAVIEFCAEVGGVTMHRIVVLRIETGKSRVSGVMILALEFVVMPLIFTKRRTHDEKNSNKPTCAGGRFVGLRN